MCGCWVVGKKDVYETTQNAALVIIQVVIFIRLKIHPSWFLPHLWVDVAQWGSFGLWLCAEVVGPVIDSWASWASALSNHMFLWVHTENDWKSHLCNILAPSKFVVFDPNGEARCIGNIRCSVLMLRLGGKLNEFMLIDCSHVIDWTDSETFRCVHTLLAKC